VDQDGIGMQGSSVVNIKIATQERKDIFIDQIKHAEEMPDAGNYTHKDTFETNKGKAAVFGAPFEHKYNENPGPGEYNETR
jgi:hypothetical protein